MRLITLLAVIVAALSTVVGCGSQHGATKVTSVADCPRDEASWTAPDEVTMSFAEAPALANNKDKPKTVSIQPNRGGRPALGAVHAATY